MRSVYQIFAGFAMGATLYSVANVPSPRTEADSIAILAQSNATPEAIEVALRHLAVHSTEASIPHLQRYLRMAEWCDFARGALETLDHPDANTALRQAAENASGRRLLGLLDSLGRRRDELAVPLAIRHLRNEDPDVAAAAARALARIGTESAIEALVRTASELYPPLPAALTEALCGTADECWKRDITVGHVAVVLAALERGPPAGHQLGPLLRHRVVCNPGTNCADWIRAAPNPVAQQIAAYRLWTDEFPPPSNLESTVIADLPEPFRSAVLAAAARTASDGAVSLLLDLSRHTDAELRRSALSIAVRYGLPTILPRLWELARDKGTEDAAHARRSLAGHPSTAADEFLVGKLHTALNHDDLLLALNFLGQRAWAPARDPVLQYTGHLETTVRIAAWSALRDLVDADAIHRIVQCWGDRSSPEENTAAEKTLISAVARRRRSVSDVPLVSQLSNAWHAASASARPSLLRALHQIGGPTAVRLVADIAGSSHESLRPIATRLLIEWRDPSALPWLEAMARTPDSSATHSLALRAVFRLTAALDVSAETKVAKLVEWEPLLATEDDRRAWLAALGRAPCVAALQCARKFLSNPNLGDEAAAAILQIVNAAPSLPRDVLRPILEEAQMAPISPRLRADIEHWLRHEPPPPPGLPPHHRPSIYPACAPEGTRTIASTGQRSREAEP